MEQVSKTMSRCLVGAILFALCSAFASAAPLEEMHLDRWKLLKEAERFQLTAAERLYHASQWKAAGDEYEKFLKLYEKSEGAPYAQLMWSHCQVKLRKQNAAIKDGFQSLLDYYPDSPEAPIAGYLIGKTYGEIGDLKPAKKAYTKLIATHPKHFTAVMARFDLVDIADKENDPQTKVNLLRELTFDVKRDAATTTPCVTAARQYTQLLFRLGHFDDGLKALATTCSEAELPHHLVIGPPYGCLPHIVGELMGAKEEATKKLGEKLADAGCAWLKTQAVNGVKDPKTKPTAMNAWYSVAEVRRYAGQVDKQKAVYDEIIATLGADDTTLSHLAQWYKASKQRDLARATYAKYKDAAAGQGEIAHSFVEEGAAGVDKAVAIYRQLAAADVKTAPAWLKLAASAYRNPGGKPDQAIAIYEELIRTDVANAGSYPLQIADTLYYAGRYKDCIPKYRALGYSVHNNNHMASANRQLKLHDEAISLYRQIMAASPDQASTALLNIAYTQEEAGKKEDAIKTFKMICDKFPKEGPGSTAHSILNEKYKIPVTLGGAKE